MYLYEDRIRAIRLYIKLRQPTGATTRQLGSISTLTDGHHVLPSTHVVFQKLVELLILKGLGVNA